MQHCLLYEIAGTQDKSDGGDAKTSQGLVRGISRSFEDPAGNATSIGNSFDPRLLSLRFPNFPLANFHTSHRISSIHYAPRPITKFVIVH
jgi:hypothetical protein